MGKTHVIGDPHGCRKQVDWLVAALNPAPDDEIIFVGDLVDRGPDSPGCIEFARKHRSVRGNHENKHVLFRKGVLKKGFGPNQINARQQFIDRGLDYNAAVDYMEKLPFYIETPDAIIVHAGMVYGIPLSQQDPKVLMGTQSRRHICDIDPKTGLPYWCALYPKHAKPIIFGHLSVDPTVRRAKNIWPIDTGCCRNGSLTALTLPDFKLTKVNGWDGK